MLTLLGHLGADAHFAVDGRDAVAMWEQDRWDVILMDIHMPEMDGLQACQVIREGERQGGRLRTPVVAVTASVLPHERSLYVEAGMDAVVPKPVEVPKLLEVLANVLADADEAAVETRGAA